MPVFDVIHNDEHLRPAPGFTLYSFMAVGGELPAAADAGDQDQLVMFSVYCILLRFACEHAVYLVGYPPYIVPSHRFVTMSFILLCRKETMQER